VGCEDNLHQLKKEATMALPKKNNLQGVSTAMQAALIQQLVRARPLANAVRGKGRKAA